MARIPDGAEGYPYSIRDIPISDPFILADEATGHYYTYVQFVDPDRYAHLITSEPSFYVLKSRDLINWTDPKVCFRRGSFWAREDYWAPEVHRYRGRYYLIASFSAPGRFRCCQALVSDSPEGPFRPVSEEPLTPPGWQCLDGTLYIDPQDKPWLVFCHEWLQVYDGQVCAIPLSDELDRMAGKPLILFRASDAPWRGKLPADGGLVTDGPFLYRLPVKNHLTGHPASLPGDNEGMLIMLWSSFSERGGYTTGVARSLTGELAGPWIQDEIPLYALDGGHAMLFRTFTGQLMMSLHCPNEHAKKRILLFEMDETVRTISIRNEITGNWFDRAGGAAKNWVSGIPADRNFDMSVSPVLPGSHKAGIQLRSDRGKGLWKVS